MIKKLKISNFKSLVGFEVEFSKFACLIGLNGSGKSTVLQAIDFLCQLMQGTVSSWLKSRDWSPKDLTCKLQKKQLILFKVEMCFSGHELTWEGEYNPNLFRCTSERIHDSSETTFLNVTKESYSLENEKADINVHYQGSILSQLKEDLIPGIINELKSFFSEGKSLELLSPHLLRQRSRSANDIGIGGEKLSAFIDSYENKYKNKTFLTESLKHFYPFLKDYSVKNLRAGWKELYISENYPNELNTPLMTEAHHINDGLLRILAILALAESHHKILLFDEIENGINPELIQKLIEHLLHSRNQIVVTTHSPMILNFLPDDEAKKSVFLVYKTQKGFTKAVPYFSLEVPASKLKMMGPGEVFLDTYLEDLANGITHSGSRDE